MPLINLQTNLKSLGFGKDRPDGGSSNQPYMKKSIPGNRPARSGPDFILRDGFLAPAKAGRDVARLTKFFTDFKSPRGLLFAVKQNVLSRLSVKTQASWGPSTVASTFNQGIYTPLSTLIQAGVGWAGIHVNERGLDPTGLIPGGGLFGYNDIIKSDQTQWDNRLTNLQVFSHFTTQDEVAQPYKVGLPVQSSTREGQIPLHFSTNPQDPVLFKYGGGPGAILGIGKTKIMRHQNTYDAIRAKIGTKTITANLMGQFLLSSYSDGNAHVTKNGLYPYDFRKSILAQKTPLFQTSTDAASVDTTTINRVISKAPGYRTKNRAVRTYLGDAGSHVTYGGVYNVFNYGVSASQMTALDKITAQPMYTGSVVDNTKAINDLVQFRIAAVLNGPEDGKNAVYMHFRAYLDDISDNYNATWNPVQYVGRGEQFFNYGGFARDIGFSFTVHATSKAELIPMYRKLNYLASTLAPDYGSNGFMKGTIHRLTIGEYLNEVPGIITNLTYDISVENGWEIGIDENGNKDRSVGELPHQISVKVAFTPIHDFLVERNKDFMRPTARFISLSDTPDSPGLYDEFGKYKTYEANVLEDTEEIDTSNLMFNTGNQEVSAPGGESSEAGGGGNPEGESDTQGSDADERVGNVEVEGNFDDWAFEIDPAQV